MNDNLHDYVLRIDGPLLANQRRLLLKVMDINDGPLMRRRPGEKPAG